MCDSPEGSKWASDFANQALGHDVVSPNATWERGSGGVAGGGGGIFGAGIGEILATMAGAALAPETGGASLLLPIAMGAAGGFGGNLLGDLFTGQSIDPLALAVGTGAGALTGGIGGALGAGGSEAVAGGADPFGAASVNPDFEGVAAQAAAGGAGPATADLAITGAGVGDMGGGFASGSTFATPATFGDPTRGAGGVPAAAGTTGGGAGSVTPDADNFPGTPASSQLQMPGGVMQASSVSDPSTLAGGSGMAGLPQDLMAFLKGNKDLLGPLMMGGSLLKSALFPNKIPGQDELGQTGGIARGIAQNFGGGNLTPQQQAASDVLLRQQISDIKAHFANLGLSGSDAEKQMIIDTQNKNFANQAQAQNVNASTALSAVGAANTPTIAIANQQVADDERLSQMLAALAAASISKA